MANQDFTLIRGDTSSITVDLTHGGNPYAPPADTLLIFTLKKLIVDDDFSAVVQKTSEAGMVLDTHRVDVEFVPQDTVGLDARKYLFDIQAQESSGAVKTVAFGSVTFTADVTRQLDTSVPIFTTNPTAYQSAAESAAQAEAAKLAAQAAQAAAETAQANAETAEVNAETAEANAETAQAAAETARNAAQAAQAQAEAARDAAQIYSEAANISQGQAADSAVSAGGSANEAETARNAAQLAQTNAESYANLAETAHGNAEAAALAANDARDAAQAAQGLAETAKAGAEAAQLAAEAARDQALTHENAADSRANDAELFRDAALAAQGAAETARDDAQGYASAASGSADAAALSASAAATSASDADADRIDAEAAAAAALASQNAAALSETGAAASANAAAASATTALQTVANQFKGGVAGNAVPATSTAAGDYYTILSAGTSQSKTWAVGDRAIYNGSSGSWTQVPLNLPTPGSALGLPGLISNGSAVPLYIPDSPVHAYGTDDLGFTLRITLADYTPSSEIALIDKSTNTNGIRIILRPDGKIRVLIGDGVNLSGYIYETTVGVQTIVADAQPMWLDVDLIRAGVMTVTVNGVQLGATVSIASSAAQSLTVAAPLRLFGTSGQAYAGVIHAFYPRNLSLTANERTALFLGGPGALPRYARGSQQTLIDSGFDSATGWTLGTGFSITGGKLVGNHTASDSYPSASFIDSRIVNGGVWRVRFTSSKTGSSNYNLYTLPNSPSGIAFGGNVNTTLTIPANSGVNGWKVQKDNPNFTAGTVEVDDLILSPLGFLGIYEVSCGASERGMVLLDRTLNRLDAIRTSNTSTSYSHNGRRAVVRATVAHGAGTTDVQLLGQSAIDTTRRWRIDSVQVVSDASVNVSLGQSSGGAQYINAQAVTATTTDIGSFVARMITAGVANLWSRSTGAANLTWIINLVAAD